MEYDEEFLDEIRNQVTEHVQAGGLGLFDRDGNSISVERWMFLISEGGTDYFMLDKWANNEYNIQTLWTGTSKSDLEPVNIFNTFIVHNPHNPHVDDVLNWSSEEEATLGHWIAVMTCKFVSPERRFRFLRDRRWIRNLYNSHLERTTKGRRLMELRSE